jgi:hypothetical protein
MRAFDLIYGPLGIYVPDVDAAIERAVAVGVTLIESAYDLTLFRIAFDKESEGHELELFATRNCSLEMDVMTAMTDIKRMMALDEINLLNRTRLPPRNSGRVSVGCELPVRECIGVTLVAR